MEVKLFNDNIETLRPIVESWQKNVMTNEFGIIADDVNKYLAELHSIAFGQSSDLLVLYDRDEPVGYFGLRYFSSPLGEQVMANESFYYVLPEKRSISSLKLIKSAKMLAKMKGCSHLILNASNLASDSHEKLCRVYEKMNFQKCLYI